MHFRESLKGFSRVCELSAANVKDTILETQKFSEPVKVNIFGTLNSAVGSFYDP